MNMSEIGYERVVKKLRNYVVAGLRQYRCLNRLVPAMAGNYRQARSSQSRLL